MIPAYLPVPGFGVLPANAFVIHAQEPVLVDAGVIALREPFVETVAEAIDLDDLRWLWLTHCDPDHIGAVAELLDAAPQLRVVTSFIGMGKLGLNGIPVPPERAYLINPRQSLNVGDRELVAVRPPVYDAPETTACFDARTRTAFTSDCFGALLPAPAESARDVPPEALRDGVVAWATVDAPWLSSVGDADFRRASRSLGDLAPEAVLGSHLPPAPGQFEQLIGLASAARSAPAFVGPDQAAMVAMMGAA